MGVKPRVSGPPIIGARSGSSSGGSIARRSGSSGGGDGLDGGSDARGVRMRMWARTERGPTSSSCSGGRLTLPRNASSSSALAESTGLRNIGQNPPAASPASSPARRSGFCRSGERSSSTNVVPTSGRSTTGTSATDPSSAENTSPSISDRSNSETVTTGSSSSEGFVIRGPGSSADRRCRRSTSDSSSAAMTRRAPGGKTTSHPTSRGRVRPSAGYRSRVGEKGVRGQARQEKNRIVFAEGF